MKRFYKIAGAFIVAGLVLIGVGGAVTIGEISSFNYMGDRYTTTDEKVVDTINVELPDNLAKIYTVYNIKADDGLEGNNALIKVTHSADSKVNVTPEINDNYYLYNTFTEKFSEYAVNSFGIDYYIEYTSDKNPLDKFKDFLNDVKEKKIYNYGRNYIEPEVEIAVSREAYERFSKAPEGYEVYSYSDYMSEMKNRTESGEYKNFNEDTVEHSY